MTGETYYLAPGVRARREKFGLLFYNSHDAKLTFLKSGDLFDVVPDPRSSFRLVIDRNASQGEGKIRRLLELLLKRGLVIETRNAV